MSISIQEGPEIERKIHHFIEDTVKDYGYMVMSMEWKITVTKLPNREDKK